MTNKERCFALLLSLYKLPRIPRKLSYFHFGNNYHIKRYSIVGVSLLLFG